MISSSESITFVLHRFLYWLFIYDGKRKDKRFLRCSYFCQCLLFAWDKQVASPQHLNYACADNSSLGKSYYLLINLYVCAWPRRELFVLRAYNVDYHWRLNSLHINVIIQLREMASSQSPAAPQTFDTQSGQTVSQYCQTHGSDKLFWYSEHQARP